MADAVEMILAVLGKAWAVETGDAVRDGRDLALYGISGCIPATVNGKSCMIVVSNEEDGAPRFVKAAAHRLRSYMGVLGKVGAAASGGGGGVNPVPVICAPFLSPKARAACTELGISWIDRLGNAHISGGGMHMDIQVPGQPAKSPSRRLKSLFGARAGMVLRVLLSEPGRPWRVVALADRAGVSVGHVSAICRELGTRAWGERRKEGFVLTEPARLLQAWSVAWEPAIGMRAFYSPAPGEPLAAVLRGIPLNAESGRPRIVRCRDSAAQWIAPFLRGMHATLYADRQGLELLDGLPGLVRLQEGYGALEVAVPDERSDVFLHVAVPAPGIVCTDALRTFLDMGSRGNEREREAAEHLASLSFPWFSPSAGAS